MGTKTKDAQMERERKTEKQRQRRREGRRETERDCKTTEYFVYFICYVKNKSRNKESK